MQTLDDHMIFNRLMEMNLIEKQVKDAFDKLTDGENRDVNEKKELRSLIEKATIQFIQNAEDQMNFCLSKLDQLQELRRSELDDEMKLKAFNYIIDEYIKDSIWRKIS